MFCTYGAQPKLLDAPKEQQRASLRFLNFQLSGFSSAGLKKPNKPKLKAVVKILPVNVIPHVLDMQSVQFSEKSLLLQESYYSQTEHNAETYCIMIIFKACHGAIVCQFVL